MRVACVVVNWNGGDSNIDCVESLLQQGPQLAQIVFVDNGSDDGSWERVAERFPSVEILRNSTNLGFGGGVNRGLEWALKRDYDAVFLVNNDVVVPPGQLELLTSALDADTSAGIVGPRVLLREDPTRIWAAGGQLTWRENLTTLLGNGRIDGPEWYRTRPVDYIVGCAMLIRREVFDAVGMLDADYFAYTEDVDYCVRAAQAGFGSRCVGEARALHSVSSSTGGGYNPRRKYMMGVNSIWFLRRYAKPWNWVQFFVFDVLSLPFAWLFGLFRGRAKAVAAKGVGIVHGLMGRRIRSEVLRPGASWFW